MSTFVLQDPVPFFPEKRIDYSRALNQEQLDVVLHGDGACLVLAGAGSGKTRTLTYRVAYLLEHGADPASILLLTFTNKAAREMQSRVEQVLGRDARAIWSGTFHAVASRLLRVFAEPLGYRRNFSILDAEDANDLVKAVMKDLSIDYKARRFPTPRVVAGLISYSRNVQHPLTETVALKHAHFLPFATDIEQIARQYQMRKKQANAMDFDDLLALMAQLLDDPAFGLSIAERFRYVLVDEYQDTNAIQARLVRGFARQHGNIVVVGDDAQSIYAFRGADVKNILSFPDQWPDVKTFQLLTNYRSTPEILEIANASLAHNVQQFEKELRAVVPHGPKPHFVPLASAAQEARYVAEQVLALRTQGLALRAIAVLFRSSAHSQTLEFELMKRDIPYEYRGGQKFFERAHIKDVLSFLRVASNPKDEVAWLRVLAVQPGIGTAIASALAAQLTRSEEFERILGTEARLLVGPRGDAGWKAFVAIGQRMMERGNEPAAMIRGIMESSYQEYMEREYPNWRERIEDLEQLAFFAENYQDVGLFLADIALYDEVMAARENAGTHDEERMVLSTIHQAKGLEWDAVFVIHLADAAFPNRRAMAEEGGMEEERRLFYVAVTRAQRHLFLTYPMTSGFDTHAFNQPSLFVEEIPPRLLDRVDVREAARRPAGFGYGVRHARTGVAEEGGWEEPAIYITDEASRPKSFLRDVNDL